MYTERYSLPFLAGALISAAERKRPGLGPWSPEVRAELHKVFETELVDMRRRFFELFEDKVYWDKVERTLMDVCFPRYCAVAEKQTELERRTYGLWRGGDLLARGAYAGGGLLLGIIMVKLPYIPIPQTWDLFAFLTMLGGPFIPDLQVWLHRRGFKGALAAIVSDMNAAEEQLKMYQPLEDPGKPKLQPVEEIGSSSTSSRQRLRNGGQGG